MYGRSLCGGLRAAAGAALRLEYGGLAAALEDLASVLAAIPADDADYIARALTDGDRVVKLDQMIMSNDQVQGE